MQQVVVGLGSHSPNARKTYLPFGLASSANRRFRLIMQRSAATSCCSIAADNRHPPSGAADNRAAFFNRFLDEVTRLSFPLTTPATDRRSLLDEVIGRLRCELDHIGMSRKDVSAIAVEVQRHNGQ